MIEQCLNLIDEQLYRNYCLFIWIFRPTQFQFKVLNDFGGNSAYCLI